MLNADPMSIEAQRLIEEEIRRENVESSFDMAWEYNPELFGRVSLFNNQKLTLNAFLLSCVLCHMYIDNIYSFIYLKKFR